uniref:Uncharacterized protein n=1 Tax=Rhizophora mucronata TaxID=61149 RepID=A0A2P2MDP7_RHIMU
MIKGILNVIIPHEIVIQYLISTWNRGALT